MEKKDFKVRNGAIIPAIFTMFDKDDNVDVKALAKLTNNLIDKNVDGFYAGGATGEGFLMEEDDRKIVIKTVVEAVAKRVPVIAYIGSNATKTAVGLAKYAEECGADAISSVPPWMGAFSFDDVYDYYKTISECVKIPLIIYANTYTRALSFDEVNRILRLPNCVGCKYTSPNHYMLRMLTRANPDKLFFSGADEMGASGFMSGCVGLIGSTYNFAPEIFLDLRDAFLNNDLKELYRLNEASAYLVDIFLRNNYSASMKKALSMLGMGEGYCRKPKAYVKEETMDSLLKGLKSFTKQYNVKNIDNLNNLIK